MTQALGAVDCPLIGADEESDNAWGFRDSRFTLTRDRVVVLGGQRYALSQLQLDRLAPWIERVMGISLHPDDVVASAFPPAVPDSRLTGAMRDRLLEIFGHDDLTIDPMRRLRHGHGHTLAEIYAINHAAGFARVPDVVVYPQADEQLERLVALAGQHKLVVIPFGGGTSVTEALRCPDGEDRIIVSVDMRRMNRLLWIDRSNRMACIQAGAVGRHIVSMLAEQGFTLGHEPDSIEFSTLGGWIATHASGMKKNKYGNIEDLVLDMTVVTGAGRVSHQGVFPRTSTGIDIRKVMYGSEGTLGIVTSAVVRISPLAEKKIYGSCLFPHFQAGVSFMYALAQEGHPPASVRLVDNLQFQFGQALKPSPRGFGAFKSRLEKMYVTRIRGLDPLSMTACTLVYEGTAAEVRQQQQRVKRLVARHGGMVAGSENGRRGYQLTFGIAYMRDFIMGHHILAESFETSVPWANVVSLCERVKRRIEKEHTDRRLHGRPFVTCRVTQLYPTGACVYFYLAISSRGVSQPVQVFSELEHAARNEILQAGGSLSHHHGIGKIRQQYLPEIVSAPGRTLARRLKTAWDPEDVFGVGNQND